MTSAIGDGPLTTRCTTLPIVRRSDEELRQAGSSGPIPSRRADPKTCRADGQSTTPRRASAPSHEHAAHHDQDNPPALPNAACPDVSGPMADRPILHLEGSARPEPLGRSHLLHVEGDRALGAHLGDTKAGVTVVWCDGVDAGDVGG